LVRFLDRFRAHYHQQAQELLPQRLANAGSLTMLNALQHENVRNEIIALLSDFHSEIVQAFRTAVLQEESGPSDDGILAQMTNVPPPEETWAQWINESDPTYWETAFADFIEDPVSTNPGTEQVGTAPTLQSMRPQNPATYTQPLGGQDQGGASIVGYIGAVTDTDGWSFVDEGPDNLHRDRPT
jgi:hypothetical protein